MIDDGDPAFPAQPIYQHPNGATSMSAQVGMSLRDYFAAQALQGMLTVGAPVAATTIAAAAYAFADALLTERKKAQP